MSEREPWIFGLTAASAVAVLVSIAAAEILLAAACLAWLTFRPRRMVWPGYVIPLCVFMATTVLSLAMSSDPSVGTGVVRKFVLFAMGFLAANFVIDDKRARLCYAALLGVAAVTSLAALGQFVAHDLTKDVSSLDEAWRKKPEELENLQTPKLDLGVLYGDGPERSALERIADELGLGERVSFAGFQADPIPQYLAADAFVVFAMQAPKQRTYYRPLLKNMVYGAVVKPNGK